MENVNVGSLNVEITGDNSDLKNKLNDTGKDLNKASGDVKQFGNNIGILRLKLRELQKTDIVGKTPEQVRALEKEIASLRDEVGDYDARLKSMSLDPFQKMAQGVQAMSSVMAGAAGAVSLFGGNQEALNAIMQKTVALMAIAQAAQTAADFTRQNAIGIFLKDKYKELAVRIQEGLIIKTNTAGIIAETGAKEGLSVIQKVLIGLQNSWNKAMNASPIFVIGAIIAGVAIGIGELTRALRKSSAAFDEAQEKANLLAKAIERITSDNKYLLDIQSKYGSSSTELSKIRIKQIDEEINLNEGLIKQNQKLSLETSFWGVGLTKRAKDAKAANVELMKRNEELFREQQLLQATQIAEDIKQLKEGQKRKDDAALAERERLAKQRKDYEDFYNGILNQQIKVTESDLKINLDWPSADDLFGQFEDQIPQLIEIFDIGGILSESATQGLNDVTSSFAEGIGNLAAGEGSMEDVFQGVSESIANFMSSLGKSLIAAGIGAIAFKKLLSRPAAAIAAGAALVALAAVVRSKLASGPSSVNTGNYSYGGSGSESGTTATRTIFADESGVLKITGKLVADGKQLVAVLDSEGKRLNG